VVTGASKGIGAGIAKQLAAEGAAVVINYASAVSHLKSESPFVAGFAR
jgi:NAD(P)-dependent dehydrogenase (short-subunit alcohol dehydrogenase family)